MLRNAFGLGQNRLGEIAKRSNKNVSKWEKKEYEPKDDVKKEIATSLGLSLDWLISGYGCPFAKKSIAVMHPSSRMFDSVISMLRSAAEESITLKATLWRLNNQKSYFSLLFQFEDLEHSIVLIDCPIGLERAFLDHIQKMDNSVYLGLGTSEAIDLEVKLTTSFDFVSSMMIQADSARPNTIMPTAYFFIDLYNMDKEELLTFIYSRAKSLTQKIDKLLFRKYVPDFLNIFPRHHDEFKKVVRSWLKGGPFTEKEKTIIESFAGETKLSSILNPPKFVWEKYLIDGIKNNPLEPFSFAYTELASLIYQEGAKMTVVRPQLDTENDRLFWHD
ncbi:MAG: helix-turn-helix domain-containing protein [Thermodesulfovibrionales bacterium]